MEARSLKRGKKYVLGPCRHLVSAARIWFLLVLKQKLIRVTAAVRANGHPNNWGGSTGGGGGGLVEGFES